jgi:ribonuclease E
MANKMLIDATHPEETRVVVVRGSRVEEFDFESASRRPLRGNIYLAKVTRVEPSLQAAFVEYGGNRHGFLAFSEIHPDYYQIPVADREALLAEEAREEAAAEAAAERRSSSRGAQRKRREPTRSESPAENDAPSTDPENAYLAEAIGDAQLALTEQHPASEDAPDGEAEHATDAESAGAESTADVEATTDPEPARDEPDPAQRYAAWGASVAESFSREDEPAAREDEPAADAEADREAAAEDAETEREAAPSSDSDAVETASSDEQESRGELVEIGSEEDEVVEQVGGDALEEMPERAPRRHRSYKIQEVIRRRQIMLVQVVKEERGTKGAALTTYLSLAGRYAVLMPNTDRGGGISRKITDAQDRKRLKEIVGDLDVPEGMGIILRTAGASRTKTEIKRDFEYLLRLWETVRDLTLKSSAPALVYEEGSLIKRSIRDLYNKDIDEILVSGEEAYREAKDFMRMLMPSHAKVVQPYRDPRPIFSRDNVEAQLDAMFSPQVTLRSGGYIVINQTEALVAIDVNSGRSTREHNIEDTALRTNMEAAEEIARQLRLRDLAGLIVIDFIDMEESRNNRSVERKLKDSLKTDRARIQVGRISHFGLMEMSRQRIRTGVLESSSEPCPHCGGTGTVRSIPSVALYILRMVEDHLRKDATRHLIVRAKAQVALYVLNQKRPHLLEIEQRFGVTVLFNADETLTPHQHAVIEKGDLVTEETRPVPLSLVRVDSVMPIDDDEDEEIEAEAEEPAEAEAEPEAAGSTGENGAGKRKRRRRKRRPGQSGEAPASARPDEESDEDAAAAGDDEADDDDSPDEAGDENAPAESADAEHALTNGSGRRRRRGRRGGRRSRRPDLPPLQEGEHVAEAAALEEGATLDRDEDRLPFTEATYAAVENERFEPSYPAAFDTDEPAAALPAEEPPAESPPPIEHLGRANAPAAEPESAAAEPLPEPAAPEQPELPPLPIADEPDRPRRTGWWQRRILGG